MENQHDTCTEHGTYTVAEGDSSVRVTTPDGQTSEHEGIAPALDYVQRRIAAWRMRYAPNHTLRAEGRAWRDAHKHS